MEAERYYQKCLQGIYSTEFNVYIFPIKHIQLLAKGEKFYCV